MKTITLFIIAVLILNNVHIATTDATNHHLKTTSKAQIQCTMCAACDNPCNKVPSPPPPPPPSSTTNNCPPPPSPPTSSGGGSSGGSYYYSPPPPPPSSSGGGSYYNYLHLVTDTTVQLHRHLIQLFLIFLSITTVLHHPPPHLLRLAHSSLQLFSRPSSCCCFHRRKKNEAKKGKDWNNCVDLQI
ncbi:hypothetical protein MtrunA17_Chr4g0068021 [Medicago truncatula]|uniref:Transmembrane protein n=1 Tax=Medicago truncatula TaxID=3880 RepID=A0A072URM8_MEDTR|nr:hypothetical protein MTR_4g121090 [Medicago truncatula]RHN64335.1 hypothetical protein MtrunA17_Chr4g0068021 [Medicago truncatula]